MRKKPKIQPIPPKYDLSKFGAFEFDKILMFFRSQFENFIDHENYVFVIGHINTNCGEEVGYVYSEEYHHKWYEDVTLFVNHRIDKQTLFDIMDEYYDTNNLKVIRVKRDALQRNLEDGNVNEHEDRILNGHSKRYKNKLDGRNPDKRDDRNDDGEAA